MAGLPLCQQCASDFLLVRHEVAKAEHRRARGLSPRPSLTAALNAREKHREGCK